MFCLSLLVCSYGEAGAPSTAAKCRARRSLTSDAATARALTIANPDGNQVRYAKGQPYNLGWGPLSQVWHMEGLNDGTTHYNYVRFQNPWSSLYLNAEQSLAVTNAPKMDLWKSEQWVMENINGTKYVRFRNLWQTNMYLTMAENNDYATVNLQPLHEDWWSQMWELKVPPTQ